LFKKKNIDSAIFFPKKKREKNSRSGYVVMENENPWVSGFAKITMS